MSKKYVVVVLVLLILVLAGGIYFWKTKTLQSVGVLPVTDKSTVDSTESTQSANPYDSTNPFSNIKVNPFE